MFIRKKDSIRALNDTIVVRPLNVERESLIHLPDIAQHGFFYGTIVNVGEKCNKVITEGSIAFFKRLKAIKYKLKGMNEKEGDVFLFKQEHLLIIKKWGEWYPIGNKLLLERLTEEEILGSGIIIPACFQTKDQTLFNRVLRKGLIYRPYMSITTQQTGVFEYPLQYGDKVKLKEWAMDIEEIGFEGKNCIIVKPSHLDYKEG